MSKPRPGFLSSLVSLPLVTSANPRASNASLLLSVFKCYLNITSSCTPPLPQGPSGSLCNSLLNVSTLIPTHTHQFYISKSDFFIFPLTFTFPRAFPYPINVNYFLPFTQLQTAESFLTSIIFSLCTIHQLSKRSP